MPTLPLPSPGDLHPTKAVTNTDAGYKIRVLRAQFLRDSVLGTGGYEDYLGGYRSATGEPLSSLPEKTYLARHPRETDVRWDRRRRTTYYPRYLEWVCNVVVGLMTRETPQRDNYPPAAAEWVKAAQLDQAWKRILPWCLMYDWTGVVVDQARLPEASSLAEQLPAGAKAPVPYVKVLHPDTVLDWGWDDQGLSWLKYAEDFTSHPDPLADPEPGQRIWVLTRAGWWRYDVVKSQQEGDTIPVTASGAWPAAVVGRVPMALYHLGDDRAQPAEFPGAWLEAPARILRRLYNLLSATAATEDNSCFPLMRMQVASPDDVGTMKTGDSTVLPFPLEASSPPDYLNYDTGPLELLARKADAMVRQLKELVSLAFDETAADSGVAKSYSFLQLNVTASKLIGSTERLERQVVDLALRFQGDTTGLPDDAVPGWPRKFDQIDVAQDVDAGAKVIDLEPGPKARAAILKRIVLGRYLQDLSSKDKKAIEREIDQEAAAGGMDERVDEDLPPDEEGESDPTEPTPPSPPPAASRRTPAMAPKGEAVRPR